MAKNSEFWTGLPKVAVTDEHIDRALRAMNGEVTNLTSYDVSMEDAMIAGAIIANMEAFDRRVGMSSLLMALAHEVLTDFVPLWVEEAYGMTFPIDTESERKQRERSERNTMRAAKAKATREAAIDARIAAAVAEALPKAA
ncbi:MAG: hypothetical protein H5U13_02430 [Parvibaculum sp.]|nr:hypothetical protein [Parvibaculum sp.]